MKKIQKFLFFALALQFKHNQTQLLGVVQLISIGKTRNRTQYFNEK